MTGIKFGTGGIREKMGRGLSCMNATTVRMATYGLAQVLNRTFKHPKVFISYDSRHHSREFAIDAAQVLSAYGIKAYVTKELRSTPFVSFGLRHLKCQAGIMITASHNPPEYNGYKVYWEDGAQVIAPHDQAIVDEVKGINDPKIIKTEDSFEWVDESLDKAYFDAINPLQNYPDDNKKEGAHLHIVYSPLHGTGSTLTPQALNHWGFTNVSLVKEQMAPDGSFPNAPNPNPETAEALQMGTAQMIKEGADLFLSNDPDGDRIGVVVMHRSQPIQLGGNEMAILALYHTLSALKFRSKLPKKGAICTTIVSTGLIPIISKSFGIPCHLVLTGFKYIGEKIHLFEQEKEGPTFLFGAEESQGLLIGQHSRDKDGTIANCLLAELALQLKKEGMTLIDQLYGIYERYGIYRGKNASIHFEKGMDEVMERLRKKAPTHFFDKQVIVIEDYLTGETRDLTKGQKEPLDLPKSNVLLFKLEDGSKLIFRPSGTEPKIKIYAMASMKPTGPIAESVKEIDQLIETRLEALKREITDH